MAVLRVLCKSCNKFASVAADVIYCPYCAAVYSECLVNLSKLAELKRASDAFIDKWRMVSFLGLVFLFLVLPGLIIWPWLDGFNKSVFPILIMMGLFILTMFVLGILARNKFPEYWDQK